MAASTRKVLSLYKSMIKESQKFTGYNYRMYAVRRVKDAFRDNKAERDVEKINLLIAKAEHNLGIIRRQTMVSQLYMEPKLVIEQTKASPS
ncbi:LYR motif-containing protein 4-like [Lineus longissimus]|uniref:LYR motif-containing protein 4-like n=1 Tax=Lineus longissimus TaxID=88925 RepID=UPI00315C8391